jgi:hypothetical protein
MAAVTDADDQAVRIVRDLAVLDGQVDISVSTITDETATVCITCEAVLEGSAWDGAGNIVNGPTEHEPSCPWRRARQWVADHP